MASKAHDLRDTKKIRAEKPNSKKLIFFIVLKSKSLNTLLCTSKNKNFKNHKLLSLTR